MECEFSDGDGERSSGTARRAALVEQSAAGVKEIQPALGWAVLRLRARRDAFAACLTGFVPATENSCRELQNQPARALPAWLSIEKMGAAPVGKCFRRVLMPVVRSQPHFSTRCLGADAPGMVGRRSVSGSTDGRNRPIRPHDPHSSFRLTRVPVMKRAAWAAVGWLLVSLAGQAQEPRASSGVGVAMTKAAQRFLAALRPDQVSQAAMKFDDPARLDWHNIPKPQRKGLQLRDMSPQQQELCHAPLRIALSDVGYDKAAKIMSLESNLLEGEKNLKDGPLRDPQRYFLTIFGKPETDGTWGWSFEGHHFSLNFVVRDGQVVSDTPSFWAREPGHRADLRAWRPGGWDAHTGPGRATGIRLDPFAGRRAVPQSGHRYGSGPRIIVPRASRSRRTRPRRDWRRPK